MDQWDLTPFEGTPFAPNAVIPDLDSLVQGVDFESIYPLGLTPVEMFLS